MSSASGANDDRGAVPLDMILGMDSTEMQSFPLMASATNGSFDGDAYPPVEESSSHLEREASSPQRAAHQPATPETSAANGSSKGNYDDDDPHSSIVSMLAGGANVPSHASPRLGLSPRSAADVSSRSPPIPPKASDSNKLSGKARAPYCALETTREDSILDEASDSFASAPPAGAFTGQVPALHPAQLGSRPFDDCSSSSPSGHFGAPSGELPPIQRLKRSSKSAHREAAVITKNYQETVISVAVSPDDKYFAAGGGGKRAMVWRIEGGEHVATFPTHDAITSVLFSGRGENMLLFVGTFKQT
eukprot:4159-Pleurochrysis_carterae.AAC.1